MKEDDGAVGGGGAEPEKGSDKKGVEVEKTQLRPVWLIHLGASWTRWYEATRSLRSSAVMRSVNV